MSLVNCDTDTSYQPIRGGYRITNVWAMTVVLPYNTVMSAFEHHFPYSGQIAGYQMLWRLTFVYTV